MFDVVPSTWIHKCTSRFHMVWTVAEFEWTCWTNQFALDIQIPSVFVRWNIHVCLINIINMVDFFHPAMFVYLTVVIFGGEWSCSEMSSSSMMHMTCWILHLRKPVANLFGKRSGPSEWWVVALLDNDIPPRLDTSLKFNSDLFAEKWTVGRRSGFLLGVLVTFQGRTLKLRGGHSGKLRWPWRINNLDDI